LRRAPDPSFRRGWTENGRARPASAFEQADGDDDGEAARARRTPVTSTRSRRRTRSPPLPHGPSEKLRTRGPIGARPARPTSREDARERGCSATQVRPRCARRPSMTSAEAQRGRHWYGALTHGGKIFQLAERRLVDDEAELRVGDVVLHAFRDEVVEV